MLEMTTKRTSYWITRRRYITQEKLNGKRYYSLMLHYFWVLISDKYNEKTETSKCAVVHGSSIFTWSVGHCNRISAKVTNGHFVMMPANLENKTMSSFIYSIPSIRGSLFRTLHRSNQKLDLKCRLRMALDIVGLLSKYLNFPYHLLVSWALLILTLRKLSLLQARGMNYLHRRSPPIIHRDLKSSNILVGKNWTVKVCRIFICVISWEN